ncbi:excisionase family DNA-binding protein [Streptomyces sp. NPDC002536]|uniref:excisionase family DNA-binding protein n=1 Tax=Streptomyces sp. NPDC001262 TaxID=3364552 RepID=UPI0036CC01DF
MTERHDDQELIVLTVEEAARRLRIGRTRMFALVSSGAVRSVTIGRLRRVPVEALSEYVARIQRGDDAPRVA